MICRCEAQQSYADAMKQQHLLIERQAAVLPMDKTRDASSS